MRVTALSSDGVERQRGVRSRCSRRPGSLERELALELDRIRERNKQLMLLVERERIQRFREQQRKVVEFGVEPTRPKD